LPSVGEFPGLVNLEAALGGTNVLVGEAPEVKEYLGDLAWYCDPMSVDDIREKSLEAWERRDGGDLRELVLNRFTWRHTATALAERYREVLAA
jgi:hypothetical protein